MLSVALPVVAIERASGSESEICLSSLLSSSSLIWLRRVVSSFSFSILSLSRLTLASGTSAPPAACRSAVSSWARYRLVLSSMRSRRPFILASVKFLTRALTALNFEPSIATLASLNSPILRHNRTNSRHTSRIALPSSLRKSAMVPGLRRGRLVVGRKPPREPDQLDIALTFALEPPARRHPVEIAVKVDLEHRARMEAGPANIRARHAHKPQS